MHSFNDPPEKPDFSSSRDLSWWQIIQRVGCVVAIRRQLNCRIGMGFLRPQVSMKKGDQCPQDQDTSLAPTDWHSALFTPMDSRMPRIVIPKSSCPEGEPEFIILRLLWPVLVLPRKILLCLRVH